MTTNDKELASVLPDTLDTVALEKKWGAFWRETGVYAWDPAEPRANNFVIDTPPPTVSGYLHMGHIFSYSQTDLIARYKRMRGFNVFYPIGYDDNGLPTERLVEKKKEIRAADMPREDFIKICHEVVTEAEEEFRALFTRIGFSFDWAQEYQTISADTMRLSQMSLLDLYHKGHLYRDEQPTLWDPADRTAIAQAEVVDKETQSVMVHIPFGLEGGKDIVIATTRPELVAACVAVMYHPEDPRASALKGRKAYSALFEAEVPLLPSDKVGMDKGSGLVMCCTFGDLTDIEWWRENRLPLRNIVGKNGQVHGVERVGEPGWPCRPSSRAKEIAPKLNGLNVRKARAAMMEALKEAGLVLKEDPVTQQVPSAERSGAPLEIIPTKQWMIGLLDKKDALLEKGREITWHPAFMRQRYEDWVVNLKWDWCISRQRFFGVPLPFWYSKRKGEEGKILIPGRDMLPVNPLVTAPAGYTMDEVEPDPDVMDTWATSSLTPQINSRAITPEYAIDAARHAKLFPADLRPQAHEIIRTWAFYTIAKSMLHEDTVPFRQTAISGWCLAPDNSKMSKSKGNVITPGSIMDSYGADVVRYWAATSRLGRDTAYAEDVLKVGKRLATKLWNASKLVGGFVKEVGTPSPAAVTETLDRWLLACLKETVEKATAGFEKFDYTTALEAAETFFWKNYCDNYLEFIKGRLYGELGTPEQQKSVKHALAIAHDVVLRLFAPFMPYLTEEIWQALYGRGGSLHARGSWPDHAALAGDGAARKAGDAAVDVLSAVRKFKANHNASMKTQLGPVELAPGQDGEGFMKALSPILMDLKKVTHAESFVLAAPSNANGAEWIESESGLLKIRTSLRG